MEQKQPNGMPQDIYPERNIQIINQSITNSDESTVADRLNKYEQLDSEERLKIAKNIAILIEKLGEKGPTYLKALLNKMIKDRENIYKTVLNQIPELDKMLAHLSTYQHVIKDILIPILVQFLNFNQLEIKEQAGKLLALLTHKLDGADRGDFVLKHVIQMAHDDGNEDNRIVAVQLFSSMSQIFGSQLCEQYIGLQILSLGEDSSFKVRKQAIKQLPAICQLVSKQFFLNRLYPFFILKSKQQSNWALRKACVEVIIDIAQMAQGQQRQTSLTQTMLSLLRDSNKWVRISAYKNLGKFIHTLKGKKIHQKLVIQYSKMIDSDVNSLGKDNEIIYSCAFNFPAVLDALGAGRWQKELWKIYEKLLKHTDKKIKKTLSESLHQVAKILGQKLTEQYLFGVVDMFFKQKTDDIKLGMIRNMAGILSVLSETKRQQFVGVFQEFQKDPKKWRIRECIAKQLGQILKLYDTQTTFVYIVPTLFKFCSDSVSIVREEAASKVGDFITKFEKDQIYLPGLIENIKAFGMSPKYTQRQSFLIMCKKLMDHKDLFLKHLMPLMEQLTQDKVLNVRLILAQTVKQHIQSKGPLAEEQVMLKLIQKLKQDQNEEIKDVFKQD